MFVACQKAGASMMKWPGSQCWSVVLVARPSHIHHIGPRTMAEGQSREIVVEPFLIF